jgi:arginine decarboxylase
MRILVLGGCGHGLTTLSAFDHALFNIGIHNYNLIRLSSIIPPGSLVEICSTYSARETEYGHRLYVVMAEQRSVVPGTVVGAALGWYQDSDGRGVFVEHADTDVNASGPGCLESTLRRHVNWSLRDLCALRGIDFHEDRGGFLVSTGVVEEQKACCAVVSAVYSSEPWRQIRYSMF